MKSIGSALLATLLLACGTGGSTAPANTTPDTAPAPPAPVEALICPEVQCFADAVAAGRAATMHHEWQTDEGATITVDYKTLADEGFEIVTDNRQDSWAGDPGPGIHRQVCTSFEWKANQDGSRYLDATGCTE
jgi:hypothetical protein